MDVGTTMAAIAASDSRIALTQPGWEGLYVREMSARDGHRVSRLLKARAEGNDTPDEAYYCAVVISDGDGNLVFDVRNQEHLDFLAARGQGKLNAILGVANKLNASESEVDEGNA